jgi:hypothetical protein
VAIAAAALPPDDPMVALSRQNLEGFCVAHGLPFDRPAISESAVVEAPPPYTLIASVPPAPRHASRASATIAVALVGLVMMVAWFAAGPWSPRRGSMAVPAAVPAPTGEPARSARGAPDAVDRTPTPGVDRAPALAPGPITLATVQLCRNLSAND